MVFRAFSLFSPGIEDTSPPILSLLPMFHPPSLPSILLRFSFSSVQLGDKGAQMTKYPQRSAVEAQGPTL